MFIVWYTARNNSVLVMTGLWSALSLAANTRLGLATWKHCGLVRDLNPGPLAPKARIIPLDQRAIAGKIRVYHLCHSTFEIKWCEIQTCNPNVTGLPLISYFTSEYTLHFTTRVYTNIQAIPYIAPAWFGWWQLKTLRARPGFEPGTSRTLSENHTPRPTSHVMKLGLKSKSVFPLRMLKNVFGHRIVGSCKSDMKWVQNTDSFGVL